MVRKPPSNDTARLQKIGNDKVEWRKTKTMAALGVY